MEVELIWVNETGIGGIIWIERGISSYNERGPGRINPYVVTQIIANSAGGVVSIAFGLQGPNTCVVTACAASENWRTRWKVWRPGTRRAHNKLRLFFATSTIR